MSEKAVDGKAESETSTQIDIVRSLDVDGIDSMESETEVLQAFAQLKVVEEALRAADRFRQESVKFAMYEAHALVRAVEISGDARLIKGKWRKMAAEWLVGLDESDRMRYIAECKNGTTIDNVYKKLVYEPDMRDKLDSAVTECKQLAVERLKSDGMVVVPEIVRERSHDFPRSMLHEITYGVRDAVRKHGGVGIGDDRGTYIDTKANSQYIGDAIATRITAVARDIESLADLSSRCESKPVFIIKGNGDQLSFIDVTYMILAGVGCADVQFESNRAKNASIGIMKSVIGDLK